MGGIVTETAVHDASEIVQGSGAKVAGADQEDEGRPTRRQAMLRLHRLEPWSVMKLSFVAAVVAFAAVFTAVAVLYPVLSGLGFFAWLQNTVTTIFTSGTPAEAHQVASWFSASQIFGWTAIIGVVGVVLFTALCTIGSVIYSLIARKLGDVEITLRETD
jgi:Transmembrane domain of unknown function (DUF3566)